MTTIENDYDVLTHILETGCKASYWGLVSFDKLDEINLVSLRNGDPIANDDKGLCLHLVTIDVDRKRIFKKMPATTIVLPFYNYHRMHR